VHLMKPAKSTLGVRGHNNRTLELGDKGSHDHVFSCNGSALPSLTLVAPLLVTPRLTFVYVVVSL